MGPWAWGLGQMGGQDRQEDKVGTQYCGSMGDGLSAWAGGRVVRGGRAAGVVRFYFGAPEPK